MLSIPVVNYPNYITKWDSIPILSNYRADPGDEFWSNFPFNPLPACPESSVNVKVLKRLVASNKKKLNRHQLKRALRVCRDLQKGGSSYQVTQLPGIVVRNTSSAYEHGRMLTDKIATWVSKGFVAGPFSNPPMAGFRANPLMAISRNSSIRPVINMSAPVNESYNDNVNVSALEKVYMSTAQMFSYTLLDAGKDAIMSKFDLSDAYKCIPAAISDLRLQGFSWLNKFFVETRMIFGAVPSVCNFDRLGNTLLTLARVISGAPARWLHRCLDDLTIVAPASSGWCEMFSSTLSKICSYLGVILAPICPKNEKAFVNKTKGTVLGITFDSRNLTWSYPDAKCTDLQLRLLTAIRYPYLSLQQGQELVGSINSFAQKSPIVKCFRQPLNSYIRMFSGD